MAVLIKLRQSKFSEQNGGGKWFAQTVSTGEVHTNDIARRIEENSTFKHGEVLGLISELVETMTHEAGHALVATLYGHRWLQVTINGCADSLGFLENLRDGNVGKSMKKLMEKIDVALAGNAAERILGTVSEGSQSDFCAATDYAKRIVLGGFGDDDELAMAPDSTDSEHEWARIRPKVNAILAERKKVVASLLSKNKAALKSVADELVKHGTLFQEDVAAMIHRKTPLVEMKEGGRDNE